MVIETLVMDILLASGSPRRRDLLINSQLKLEIMSVDIDESLLISESPTDYIERMVASKAIAAIAQLNADYQAHESIFADNAALPDTFIMLTADTIGVLPDGTTVLVKPTDREHAYQMWQHMSDNTHQVWTGVQVTQVSFENEQFAATWQRQIVERTKVTFVPLTALLMKSYWDSGEPADKAGAYGIQGLAAAWVTSIEGSYTNVVGLPLAQTLALIAECQSQSPIA